MKTLAIGALAAICALAAAALGGCGSYEQRCDLNPYSCSVSGAGAGAAGADCGPCEVDDGLGACEPVALVSPGACNEKETCSADLDCKKAPGQPCGNGSNCVTGVCSEASKTCVSCSADADCAEHADSPLCRGGWCRRPAGSACKTDVACVTGLCAAGVCAACSADADCASGQCDDDTQYCLASAGEPCAGSADCASGQCQKGACAP